MVKFFRPQFFDHNFFDHNFLTVRTIIFFDHSVPPPAPQVATRTRAALEQLGAAADGALPLVVNRNRRFTRVSFEIFFKNSSKNI